MTNPWGLQLFVYQEDERRSGVINVVHSPQMDEVAIDDHGCRSHDFKPLLVIDRQDPALQDLLNQLWELGIRPKDIGTAGHLSATQAHLADMKALVSKAYEVKLT